MHQTFYIDIDEEITSIVDRLRKAKSKEVVIVVPKRAILIQSIVNLKLLKKEADGLGKELIIVTQDKFGKMLIEKAGIAVEQKLDDVAGEEVIEAEKVDLDDAVKINISGMGEQRDVETRKRVDKIGSDGYYQNEDVEDILSAEKYITEAEQLGVNQENVEKITNKELVIDVGDDLKKQKSSFSKNMSKRGFAPMDMIRNVEISEDDLADEEEKQNGARNEIRKTKEELFHRENIQSGLAKNGKPGEKKVENFFALSRRDSADEYKSINVGNNLKKYFITFCLIAVLAIAGAAAYLFLPKATITVFEKKKIQSVDLQIDGNTSAVGVDLEKEIVPTNVISISDELTKKYDVTGSKNASNQKAHGTITIYNEFSSSPQPLVATTRFASADGKIFRLSSGVSIPGSQNVGGQITPGAIEAEVIADEAGTAYNIDPTSFTIPGFQSSGNEKYTKIYAKSFKAMTGGGQSGNQAVKTITDTDINSAKTKVAQELKPSIIQRLKDSAGADFVLLDDAVNIDDSSYTLSNSTGDAVDNFSVTVKMKASAIVFKQADMKNIVATAIAKKGADGMQVSENSINMDFGKSDANFKDGSIIIRVHGSGNIIPNIDLTKVKQGLLGRQEDELKAYLSGYTDIDRVEVSYWPSFLSGKIPNYDSRVDIVLDKN